MVRSHLAVILDTKELTTPSFSGQFTSGVHITARRSTYSKARQWYAQVLPEIPGFVRMLTRFELNNSHAWLWVLAAWPAPQESVSDHSALCGLLRNNNYNNNMHSNPNGAASLFTHRGYSTPAPRIFGTRGQWPYRLASNGTMKMTSDLNQVSSFTLVSMCICPPRAILVTFEALVTSKGPWRSLMNSNLN